jgi:hypothetical protein
MRARARDAISTRKFMRRGEPCRACAGVNSRLDFAMGVSSRKRNASVPIRLTGDHRRCKTSLFRLPSLSDPIAPILANKQLSLVAICDGLIGVG